MELILASNSPRRKELLKELGYFFKVIPSNVEEIASLENGVYSYVEQLATLKASDVFDKYKNVVLGADTIVYFNGKIMGKPTSYDDAIDMLTKLSNNVHEVITGFAVITENKKIIGHAVSKVTFNDLSEKDIKYYVDAFKPFDKAGAYGIQDGYSLVKKIEGSYTNVVGLPTEKINEILKEIL